MTHAEDEEEEQDILVEPLLYDEEDEKALKSEESRRRGSVFLEYDTKESPILPMRYTDSKYEDEFGLEYSANILSVSKVSSDLGFPINVYGSVIARDSIDYKCIYLFHRHRDDCQPINPEDKMLILNGPSRGLVLVDFIFLEIDLKIKEDKEYPDRQFSKGLISIDGRVLPRDKHVVVRSETLDSWLSTMEVRFATVLDTVECTFEMKLLEGHFSGKITVGIISIEQTIMIHDSKASSFTVGTDDCEPSIGVDLMDESHQY